MFNLQSGQKLHVVMLQAELFENVHARVMGLVHDTSSECAIQMYEVLLKYLLVLSSYRADTAQTDTWTDARITQDY